VKLILVAVALALVAPNWLSGQTPAPSTLDIVFLKDAAVSKRVGRVLGLDAQALRLQVPLPGAGTNAFATVTIPRGEVERVEFAENKTLEEWIRSDDAAHFPRVEAAWKQWLPYLSLPKSPTARIGNAYGEQLLRSGEAARVALALETFAEIEKQAWSEEDRMNARQGRLRAMIAAGRAADAVNEAKELAAVAENPAVLIEAKFILAEAAHRNLARLLDENPRWEEDDNIRPERHRLYHEAVDLYLYPYLFFGSVSDAAARGLWGAVEVYKLAGETRDAIESARDLATLYPDSRYGVLASDFLNSLPEEAKQPDHKKDAQHEL
jgi:hypothetical protein